MFCGCDVFCVILLELEFIYLFVVELGGVFIILLFGWLIFVDEGWIWMDVIWCWIVVIVVIEVLSILVWFEIVNVCWMDGVGLKDVDCVIEKEKRGIFVVKIGLVKERKLFEFWF